MCACLFQGALPAKRQGRESVPPPGRAAADAALYTGSDEKHSLHSTHRGKYYGVCMHVCVSVYICVYVYICICILVYLCIDIDIYILIYVY